MITDNYINKIITGDCRKIIPMLPDESVDMVITSPPYWKLRDYNHPCQMGMEKTPEDYIDNLAGVFNLIKRVLKPEGSLWINIGDQYRKKHLMGLPWLLILKLKEQGWILRNACIWCKPNPLPVSVKDRLNQDYEYLFHLVKNRSYYYDLDSVRLPHTTTGKRSAGKATGSRLPFSQNPVRQPGHPQSKAFHPLGKNPGSLICLPSFRYGKNHPASYPPQLCRVPILTSCPPEGIVLDPFAGSGSSLKMAKNLGRKFIGIEVNRDYAEHAAKKLGCEATSGSSILRS